MREWGAEALTALIKAGLAYKHDPPLAQNQVGNDTMGYLEEEEKKKKKANMHLSDIRLQPLIGSE